MWHSEEDLIKDLVFLNDFGDSGDKESYKILYSKGRGKSLKKKLDNSETFVDCRTGEVINLNDINFDMVENVPKKGRGRGSMSKSLAKTHRQLQKQLRMARPLGSGDNIIETYCRRNKPADNFLKTEESLSSESNKTEEKEPETKILFYPNSLRVKATRNSNTQSNALIQGLLSKSENHNNVEQNTEKNTIGKSKVELENTNSSKEAESVERTVDVPIEISEKSEVSTDCFSKNINFMYDYETQSDILSFSDCSEEFNEDLTSDMSNVTSRSSSPGLNKKSDELYKKLGEKLNKFDRTKKNTFGRGNYDFSNAVRFISPLDMDQEFTIDELAKSPKNSNFLFILNEKDFPSLKKN